MSGFRLAGSLGLFGLFLALAALAFMEVPVSTEPPQSSSQESADGQEVEQTKQALEAMSDGEMDEAAETVAATRGLVPAGDTCGARRPNVMPPLSRSARTKFAAASLAASPATRFQILDEVEASEPTASWRIRIEKSEVARRAGDLNRAAREAEAALGMNPPGTCMSDAWFAKALAVEGDDRTEALFAAVNSDPGNYNAWARLSVDFMREIENGATAKDCDSMMAKVIEGIVYLDKLAKTDAQLARLERMANASTRSASAARQLLLGMIQERTRRSKQAEETYLRILEQPGSGCAAPVRLVAKTRFDALHGRGSK